MIPANYILRAIPLQAGTHRLRIGYRPAKFVGGKLVSPASLALFRSLLIFWGLRGWRHRSASLPTPA